MKPNVFTLVAVMLLVGCQTDPDFKQIKDSDEDDVAIASHNYVKGRVEIKFNPSVEEFNWGVGTRGIVQSGIESFDEIALGLEATSVRRIFTPDPRFEAREKAHGLHLWYELAFDETVPATKAVSDFSKLDFIDIVEPVYVRTLTDNSYFDVISRPAIPTARTTKPSVAEIFDDPRLGEQWHYHNVGQFEFCEPGCDIDVYDAWRITAGHPDVIVAIVDGGVLLSHPDLVDNLWINEAEFNGSQGIDDDDNGFVDDIHGYNFYSGTSSISSTSHGSHVAGTVGATNNNNTGVSGVAGGSGKGDGVRLMICQTFVEDVVGGAGFADAIKYAANNGAVICQCSWGGYETNASQLEAIRYFIANAGIGADGSQTGPMRGGICIFAAGNSTSSIHQYPAGYEEAFSVSALASDYIKSNYSNYGDWVDICAPGGSETTYGKYTRENKILSTLGDGYGYDAGTSMACPHVAGVAALMVSKFGVGNSNYTAQDLWHGLLAATRPEVYEYNSFRIEGLLGKGMISAAKALYPDPRVAPDNVTDLKVTWEVKTVVVDEQEEKIEVANLEWTVPKDGNDLAARNFRIYWKQGELSDSDIADLPDNVGYKLISARQDIGTKVTYTIEGLKEQNSHHILLRTFDMFDNYAEIEVKYDDGTSPGPGDDVFEQIKDMPNMYFGRGTGEGQAKTYNLSDYFTGTGLTHSAVSSDGTVTRVSVNGDIITVVPLKLGPAAITVTVKDYSGETITATFLTMTRDDNQAIDLYPVPVIDNLSIRMGENVIGAATLRIINSGGQNVFERKVTIDPYKPLVIDLSELSSGTYIVGVSYNGKETRGAISKR